MSGYWRGGGCLALAAACLATAGYDFARALRVGNWPVAPGRVVYSELKTEQGGEKYRHSIDIVVEYAVSGKQYRTGSIRADSRMSAGDRTWADHVLGQYQKGTAVEVHYRAENPGEAIVERWPQPAVLVVGAWGLAWLFAGVWVFRHNGKG